MYKKSKESFSTKQLIKCESVKVIIISVYSNEKCRLMIKNLRLTSSGNSSNNLYETYVILYKTNVNEILFH